MPRSVHICRLNILSHMCNTAFSLNFLGFLLVVIIYSVGIATGYRLDGPGIESREGRDSSHTSRMALGSTQPPVKWVSGLSRGQSGRGVVLTIHPLLAPMSRECKAIPLPPPLWAFESVKGYLYP
jgi:hypothetical protein